jgi:hypothetical protein
VNTNHASARPGWDNDAVHLLLWALVAQATRLTNPDGLSYSLGRAIAVGESRQTAPTRPSNGGGR